MQQIKAKYNIDKVALEEERLKSYIQLGTLIVVVIILIILVAFMLRISHVRKAFGTNRKKKHGKQPVWRKKPMK